MEKKKKKNNQILATIFIPVYNQEKLIIRALNSIPTRKDLEIMVLNDGSEDNTYEVIKQYKQQHSEKQITILSYTQNRGLGAMKNIAFEKAKGMYIGELDSDDYYYTDKINQVLQQLDGKADMVYLNLECNNKNIFELNEHSKMSLCGGACKFIKKDFLKGVRCLEVKSMGEDWVLNEELQKKPHIDKFTNIIAYHYNFPRPGSIFTSEANFLDNKISVIIPVKDRKENTKKLIEELIFQKIKYYPETEIILIENNSIEDMSFLDNYKEIKVIHNNNIKTAAAARNIGLTEATGQYISFIDNDDFISKDYLHQLYQTMRNTNCDWCVFPWFVDNEPIVLQIDINNPLATSWSIWSYCFNRRIIKDTKFNFRLNVGEDIEWIHKIITSNTKGVQIYTPLYYFTWDGNDNSLSHLYNNGKMAKENE